MRNTSWLRSAAPVLLLVASACTATTQSDEPSPSPSADGGTTADGGVVSPGNPDGGGASDGSVAPGAAAKIPKPTGTCPTITAGDVTFAPAGVPPRKVKLAFEGAAKGPLLLYWHATGSSPAEAAYSLGASEAAFTGGGGVVAAPYSDPAAGQFEWFLVNQSTKQDDFLVADEIVACLAEAGRIDPNRVHAAGMSAGGLQTTALGYYRSAYVASVATFSGGLPTGFDPPPQAAGNKVSALVFHGGTSDSVYGVDFTAASVRYAAAVRALGNFSAICDHGKGHSIPRDAAPSLLTFFAAHPFGTSPSPYAGGLPASFPAYCKL